MNWDRILKTRQMTAQYSLRNNIRRVMLRNASLRFLLSLARLSRTGNLIFLALTLVLAALFLTRPLVSPYVKLHSPELWLAVLSTCCVTAAGYIINDYFDVRIDRINRPARTIIDKRITRRQALFLHGWLSAIGLIASAFVGEKLFLLTLAAVVLLTLYSAYLKRTPLWGNLLVATLTALAVVVAGLAQNQVTWEVWVFFLFSFMASLIREIVKDMEDMRGDAQFGCRTLPIVWGLEPTKTFVLWICGLFALMLPTLSYPVSLSLFVYNFVLAVLVLFLAYQIRKAGTHHAFRQLSRLCKAVLALGVIGMLLV
jgi:4-hydroxybenzoate polyprenyltransferase